jgi:hypothetical protein
MPAFGRLCALCSTVKPHGLHGYALRYSCELSYHYSFIASPHRFYRLVIPSSKKPRPVIGRVVHTPDNSRLSIQTSARSSVETKPGATLSMSIRHVNLATVTYLFDGEIIHRDSLGTMMPIRPGAVNWMTAGRGIVHSERTSPELKAHGSRLFGLGCSGNTPTLPVETGVESLDCRGPDQASPCGREDPHRHPGWRTHLPGHGEFRRPADCARCGRYRTRCDQNHVALAMASGEKWVNDKAVSF